MEAALHQNKTFDTVDYSDQKLSDNEFINCEFINCNFSKSDFSYIDFLDCTFKNCNLSLAVLKNTGLKNINFIGCKLMGLDFSASNSFLFSMNFQDCMIDYSTFIYKKLKKTYFTDCSLKEVDFSNTDLSLAVFKNCDLSNATFVECILEKTDFRSSRNYAFDPSGNKIKRTKVSHTALAGLLEKFDLDIE
ncbi:MAG: pentapeptide repeat-containing protein [Flavobacterium circumlabens]|uniref:pentapeptide repeat-containing protein n=1 Tax=Flavobacterium circumlabens TaxID=2133765 RepID=UPI00326659CE